LVLSDLNDGKLFVCKTDGTGLRQLTVAGRFREPHWSADGHRIVFLPENLGDWSLWSIAPDGSDLRKIRLPVAPGSPALSLDGSRLAVLDSSGTVDVLRTDSETATITDTLPAMPGKKTKFMPAAWSPDGTQLAGHTSSNGVAIYSFGARRYQDVADEGVSPTWFEDGKRLLFTVWNPPKMVMLDLRSHSRSELFAGGVEDVISGARPTRDGRRVYFVHSRVPVTVWTAELK
jgi:Tol biopolymer transport system component